ncbi:MAG: aminotransferase class V-fold PLP-dependent enzyme, partial [bacterium]|nr:aminotransferase class V-fold PLP-dependent enzyme [bacterium]
MRPSPVLDIDFVRRQFPTLNDQWTLFDNAGGSVPLAAVIDTVRDFMTRHPVQLGASYALSEEATERVRAGHEAMAELIHAEADEVVLGPSTTANLRLLTEALRPLWREGDEVVVTNLDHEANVGCWRRLEATGIGIREWRVHPDTAALELADLDALVNERTRLVAFSHCSNIVGAVNDVAAVTRRVHEAGALVCVDGVAFAPHRRVDVKALEVDFYALSL